MPRRPKPPDPPPRRRRATGSIAWSEPRLAWRARLPPSAPGGRRERWFPALRPDDREAAHAAASAWLAGELSRDEGAFDPGLPLGEFLDYFRALSEPLWELQTRRKAYYESAACKSIAHVPLDRVRTDHAQLLVAALFARTVRRGGTERPVGRAHVGNVLGFLRRALAAAVRWGLLPRNPAEGVTLPKRDPASTRTWDADEAARLVDATRGHPYEAAFALWLGAGLRLGESLAATWDTLDWGTGELRVESQRYVQLPAATPTGKPKNRRVRTVYVAPWALARLRAIRDTSRVLGPRIAVGHPETVRRRWRDLQREVGVRHFPPHGARHALLSALIEAGVPPAEVSAQAGHANPGITLSLYSWVLDARRSRLRETLADLHGGDAAT